MLEHTFLPRGERTLLLIHGLGSDRDCFRAAMTAPELSSFSLVMPDLPGFGESRVTDGNYRFLLKDAVQELVRLCQGLQIQSCSIVGHSMGGAIAVMMAEIFPVTHFVNAVGNLVSEDTLFSRWIADQTFEKFSASGFRDFKRAARIGARADRPVSSYLAALEKTSARALYFSAKDLVELSDHGDLLNRFVRLKSRKIYLQDEDNPVAPAIEERLREAGIPRIVIPGTGHGLMEDKPDEFYRHVASFLQT